MNRNDSNLESLIQRSMGAVGLFLVGLIGWAADRLESRAWTVRGLARLVVAAVAAIGWVVDRLFPVAPPRGGRWADSAIGQPAVASRRPRPLPRS